MEGWPGPVKRKGRRKKCEGGGAERVSGCSVLKQCNKPSQVWEETSGEGSGAGWTSVPHSKATPAAKASLALLCKGGCEGAKQPRLAIVAFSLNVVARSPEGTLVASLLESTS